MDTKNFSPFSDPQVRRKQQIVARASYKAFNAVAGTMLDGLKRMFPNDATLRLITNEFTGLIDPERKPPQVKTPALNFFREMRKPYTRADGSTCDYIELLSAHDESAFDNPPVAILKGVGMAAKWQMMDGEARKWCWDYLDQLIHLSAQAVYSSSGATEEMNRLSRSIVNAAVSGKGTPEKMVTDPAVKAAATAFVDTIK